MAVPSTILIPYTEDNYFQHVGRDADGGPFLGILGAQLAEGPGDARSRKRWYAMLFRFDDEGALVSSDIAFAGTAAEPGAVDRAREKLLAMKVALGDVEPDDIEVGLFTTTFDGFEFGLIDASDPEVGERVKLVPCDIVFRPPWDGGFAT